MPGDNRMVEKVISGQKLLYAPARGEPREVTVTKVGRKWFEADGIYGRVSVETMDVDGRGYSSPGHCWPSREAYDTEMARQRAWRGLRDLISGCFYAPDNISLNQIENARRALFKEPK